MEIKTGIDVHKLHLKKALGTYKPITYLSNIAVMYFEEPTFAHRRIFPICPVAVPSGHFYTFSKGDLARDNVGLKPPYGKVAPAVFGISNQSYSCQVYQIIIGLDQILTLPYMRTNATVDPRRMRVRTISEQLAHHQELDFAEKFFNATAWDNTWTGAASADPDNKKFKKFDNSDVDPVVFFDERITDIRRSGRRKPNKLALGIDTFNALKNNQFILDRIKYSGTTQNPAIVNENVLAQIFGVDEVVVLDATYNAAEFGAPEQMEFICDSKGALLLYTPAAPSIDEPSAGYCFSYLLDNNNYIGVSTYEGAPGEHTELMEGLIAYDEQITGQDLAIYMTDCVG